ncbi:hypothetical protein BG004_008044 [Podila humilis]|nr:hypothetical protein BG004_008044 [Podila humilis]
MESAWTNRKHSKSQNDTAAGNNAPGSKLVQLQRQQSAAPATSSISSTSTTPTPSKISLSVRGKTTGSSSSPSNKSQRSTATNGLGSKKPVSSSSSSPSPQSSSLSSTPNPLASSSSVTTSQSGGGVGVGTGSETGSGSKIAATALPPVAAVSTDIHPLHYNWVFWFMHRNPGSKIVDYESAMMKVATFGSVEDFWAVYSHLKRPHELPNMSDYHMFKQGVRPVWEDEMNIKGGKWIVRLKKGLSSRYWENLI